MRPPWRPFVPLRVVVPLAACLLCVLSSRSSLGAPSTPAVDALILERLSSLSPPVLQGIDPAAARQLLRRAYTDHADRSGAPLWTVHGRPTVAADHFLRVLRSAESYGLRPADYDAQALTTEATGLASSAGGDPERQAQFELRLSRAALTWVVHLHHGRANPQLAGFHLSGPRTDLDFAAAVRELAATNDIGRVLAAIEPQFYHYRLLEQALPHYRELASDPTLTQLPDLTARSIRPGDFYRGAPALRRLLVALGDLPITARTPDSDLTLDTALVAALTRFQSRHGLAADGTLGRATYQALTTPLTRRVRQIELTLERWRWLPSLTTPPIIVNIPQFKLYAFRSTEDRRSDVLQMDVIVGQTFAARRTPVFAADMQYVVFRPYWDVPFNIMKQEMLPGIRADGSYLEKHHLEIVRGPGDDAVPVASTAEAIAALAAGKLRVRQRPGADNALGLIKFMFPNSHNVYLHSTPTRELFKQSQRAFSHGCVRVSDPIALAVHVLRNTPGDWTPENIEAGMNGSTRRVTLAQPIPVMILYGTALATEAGEILFFEDLYGLDRKLERLLGLPALASGAE